jgi:hypothetical protein
VPKMLKRDAFSLKRHSAQFQKMMTRVNSDTKV